MEFYYIKKKEDYDSLDINVNNWYFVEETKELIIRGVVWPFYRVLDSSIENFNDVVQHIQLIDSSIAELEKSRVRVADTVSSSDGLITIPSDIDPANVISVMWYDPSVGLYANAVAQSSGLYSGRHTDIIFAGSSISTVGDTSVRIWYING